MTGGEIAGLIAAGAFVMLVLILAVLMAKVGRTVDETTRLVRGTSERTMPLLGELGTTVRQVNGQLERVDAITANAQTVTTNVAALTSLFAATVGGPVIRVAALSYGVRHAIRSRREGEVTKRVRAQMKAERRERASHRREA